MLKSKIIITNFMKGKRKMNESKVQVQITKDLVQPIIQAKIEAAIVSALADEKGLVEKTVAAALSQKVDSEGKVNSSDYQNKQTRVEYLSVQLVQQAAKDALARWVSENQKQIEKAMYEELSRKSQTSKLVKAILAGLVDSTKSQWRFDVSFEAIK